MDRPHLVGWGSLDRRRGRSLTSLVAARALPRRFQTRREAGSTRTVVVARSRIHPLDQDRHHAAPCGTTWATIVTPSVVSWSTGSPRSPIPPMRSWLNALGDFAHRSRLGAAASCVSTWVRSAPRSASCRRFALRPILRSRRAMRRTDFCLLTFLRTSTRASSAPDASRA